MRKKHQKYIPKLLLEWTKMFKESDIFVRFNLNVFLAADQNTLGCSKPHYYTNKRMRPLAGYRDGP